MNKILDRYYSEKLCKYLISVQMNVLEFKVEAYKNQHRILVKPKNIKRYFNVYCFSDDEAFGLFIDKDELINTINQRIEGFENSNWNMYK